MARIYYCYSCGEYFNVKRNVKINEEAVICPHCEGDDTEHAPEEENNNQDDELPSKYSNDLDEEYDPADIDSDPDKY